MSNTFSSLIRVGTDPVIRNLPSGTSVLTFNAASSTGYGDKKKTLWVRVAYFRNPEKIKSYISKGDMLFISGEISQNEYQANDGTTKVSLELNANVLDLVGRKNSSQPKQADDFDDDIPF